MGPSTSDLRIGIACQDRLIVTITKNKDEFRRFSTKLSPINLAQFRNNFYAELDKFWQLVGVGLDAAKRDAKGTPVDFRAVSAAMHHLFAAGVEMNFEIFGSRHDDVEQYLVEAFPGWRESAQAGLGYRAPTLQVTSRIEHLLPFEFLPLFDTTTELPEIRSTGDLALAAARFLGFSTLIHRVPVRGTDEESDLQGTSKTILLDDPIIQNLPRLVIRFFQHAGLPGAKEEREFFDGAGWADVRGPWPTTLLDPTQFTSELATQLWEASTPKPSSGVAPGSVDIHSETTEIGAQPPDQVHHFSCHCDTDRTDYREYSLYLAHKKDPWFSRRSEQRATIGSLERKFGVFSKRPPEACPLIFFNACGASKLTPNGVTSFPDLFLEIGNRAVVGSETSVPDFFAAAFAKEFYTNLMRPFTIAQAIYNARWSLLKTKNNPLGILYAAYGNPDLRVRKPLTQSVASHRA